MDKKKEPLNRELPEYEVIQDAVSGNILAINQILDHYRGYIIKKSIRKLKDEYGKCNLGCKRSGNKNKRF